LLRIRWPSVPLHARIAAQALLRNSGYYFNLGVNRCVRLTRRIGYLHFTAYASMFRATQAMRA